MTRKNFLRISRKSVRKSSRKSVRKSSRKSVRKSSRKASSRRKISHKFTMRSRARKATRKNSRKSKSVRKSVRKNAARKLKFPSRYFPVGRLATNKPSSRYQDKIRKYPSKSMYLQVVGSRWADDNDIFGGDYLNLLDIQQGPNQLQIGIPEGFSNTSSIINQIIDLWNADELITKSGDLIVPLLAETDTIVSMTSREEVENFLNNLDEALLEASYVAVDDF